MTPESSVSGGTAQPFNLREFLGRKLFADIPHKSRYAYFLDGPHYSKYYKEMLNPNNFARYLEYKLPNIRILDHLKPDRDQSQKEIVLSNRDLSLEHVIQLALLLPMEELTLCAKLRAIETQGHGDWHTVQENTIYTAQHVRRQLRIEVDRNPYFEFARQPSFYEIICTIADVASRAARKEEVSLPEIKSALSIMRLALGEGGIIRLGIRDKMVGISDEFHRDLTPEIGYLDGANQHICAALDIALHEVEKEINRCGISR